MEYDPSDEHHRELMEYLLAEGAAMHDGVDEDGEPVYRFDMDILEEGMPELHAVMQEDMDQVLVDLYQKGLIDVSYDENLNAIIAISEEGKRSLIEAGFNLNEDYDTEQ